MIPAMSEASVWKKCNTCKAPIGFGQTYWVCNVTTCNRRDTSFVFCKVTCWDAHLPIMSHKNAWAVEKSAPTQEEWKKAQEQGKPVRKAKVTKMSTESGSEKKEVLIVASKLKAYIKTTASFNTSGDVMEKLSDVVRAAADNAVETARSAGRKTVMAKDFD